MSAEDLNSYIPVVEGALAQLGVPVEMTRTDNPLFWSLSKGSANVLLRLQFTASFGGSKGLLVVACPFMKIPTDATQKATLMEELMKMNHQASITSFNMGEGYIYLLTNRFVKGMDSSEIVDMLQELGTYADYFDDQLQAKYGNLIVKNDDTNTRR